MTGMGMRDMRRTRAPDHGAKPGKRGDDEIDQSTDCKDLECTVPIAETRKKKAKDPIGHGKNAPGDQSREQQATRQAEEAHHGYHCQK